MIGPEQKLASLRWSSIGSYMSAARKRPKWLRVDRLLGEHGVPRDSKAGRKRVSSHFLHLQDMAGLLRLVKWLAS
jgi:hypothetical protein